MSAYTKAIVAAVMALLNVATVFGYELGISEADVSAAVQAIVTVASLVGAFGVYQLPNRSNGRGEF